MYFLISWPMRQAVLYEQPNWRCSSLADTPWRVTENRYMA